MASINKIKYIFIVFLSSCSIVSINNFTQVTKDFFFTKEINLTEEIINSEVKVASIKINRDDAIMITLSDYNDNKKTWKTSDDKTLIFNAGKLIKTYGFNNNLNIEFLKDNKNNFKDDSQGYLSFDNPAAKYLDIYFSYKQIEKGFFIDPISKERVNYTLIEENFNSPKIRWKGKNLYWIDNKNNLWRSEQYVTPFGDKITFKLIKK